MSQAQTYYNRLGLSSNATVEDVRSAYKSLALQQHPDKVPESDREQATKAFQQLQDAYEFCLISAQTRSQLHSENLENDDQEDPDDDDSDWRGHLPVGIGGSGPWWEELTGNEPIIVLRWAIACEKAVLNAPRLYVMSKTERDQLNEEYAQAYHRFEAWRQKHIEKFEQEDRLQHYLSSLPARLGQHARAHLVELYLLAQYKYESGDLTKADEQACFQQPEPDSLKIPSHTWRDNHNSASSIPAQTRLEQFERQVAAADAHGILDRPYDKEKQRAEARASTAARLKAAAKEEKEEQMEKQQCRRVKKLSVGAKSVISCEKAMIEQG